jgi:hypothetical protein
MGMHHGDVLWLPQEKTVGMFLVNDNSVWWITFNTNIAALTNRLLVKLLKCSWCRVTTYHLSAPWPRSWLLCPHYQTWEYYLVADLGIITCKTLFSMANGSKPPAKYVKWVEIPLPPLRLPSAKPRILSSGRHFAGKPIVEINMTDWLTDTRRCTNISNKVVHSGKTNDTA